MKTYKNFLRNVIYNLLKEEKVETLPAESLINYWKVHLSQQYKRDILDKIHADEEKKDFYLDNLLKIAKPQATIDSSILKVELDPKNIILQQFCVSFRADERGQTPYIAYNLDISRFDYDNLNLFKCHPDGISNKDVKVEDIINKIILWPEAKTNFKSQVTQKLGKEFNLENIKNISVDPMGFQRANAYIFTVKGTDGRRFNIEYDSTYQDFFIEEVEDLTDPTDPKSHKKSASIETDNSEKNITKKAIADFTREVIQGMNLKQNRKNVSVVDKTLNWLKNQNKLKA